MRRAGRSGRGPASTAAVQPEVRKAARLAMPTPACGSGARRAALRAVVGVGAVFAWYERCDTGLESGVGGPAAGGAGRGAAAKAAGGEFCLASHPFRMEPGVPGGPGLGGRGPVLPPARHAAGLRHRTSTASPKRPARPGAAGCRGLHRAGRAEALRVAPRGAQAECPAPSTRVKFHFKKCIGCDNLSVSLVNTLAGSAITSLAASARAPRVG